MRKVFTRLLVPVLLLCTAGVASAANFPNATCPDSVTIQQIQDITAACHPAVGDTIGETRVNIPPDWRLPPYDNPFGAGLGGIIIGFDPIATGFDTYIQNTPGGPWSGVDVFFHGRNPTASPFNFAIGDSIVVEWMRTGEFQFASQVLAPNNNFTAPNGIVRKVSSGNPLPPFFVGTSTQLNELPTNTFAEQYEGCLVKIDASPTLTVARTSLTGGLGQNNAFLIVDPAAISDSVFVDGNKLTTYPPPSVGTPILSVQGILNQANRGYRIMIRSGNDVVANTPPNVIDAYPVQDNVIKVKFDRDVTAASATTLTNYSLASFGSVDGVVTSGADAVLVTITNGLGHGDLESITVNGVTGQAAGQTMTTPQSRTFYNGILTAEEIQRANTDSLSATPPCVDRSRFAGPGGQISQGPVGTRASMAGVMGARYGTLYYMMDNGNPDRGGVAAFAPPATLNTGERYRLTGGIQEFFGESEFSNIIEVESLGAGVVPTPVVVTVGEARRDTCDYNQNLSDGEDFEGRFVTLQNVKVVQRFPTLPTNGFHVAAQSFSDGDTIFVMNLSGVLNPLVSPPLGNMVSVTGVVHYEGASFRVCPRDYADIVDHGLAGVGPGLGALAFSVAPNPARRATFSVNLPQAGEVEIGIYDVAGRQVASLVRGHMPAGAFTRDWSGEDGAGRQVGAGVYFARLKVAGIERALRTVYLGR
jgi:hypothetical protein